MFTEIRYRTNNIVFFDLLIEYFLSKIKKSDHECFLSIIIITNDFFYLIISIN